MVSPENREAAIALKDKGNAAFKQHDWPAAIDFYTAAIEKDNTQVSFYTNRAAANIKLEAYGYAIADCSKAIEIDPTNVKVAEPVFVVGL